MVEKKAAYLAKWKAAKMVVSSVFELVVLKAEMMVWKMAVCMAAWSEMKVVALMVE